MTKAQGGCLCGALRYEVTGQPARTTFCHCKFCQRATGGAYMVEPVYEEQCFGLIKGSAKQYTHISEGSGKNVYIHFCDNCGTKLYLTFDSFKGFVGIYGGTLDDPDWLEFPPEHSQHIFLGVAQKGTIIPPDINTFVEHVVDKDGAPAEPTVFDTPHVIERE